MFYTLHQVYTYCVAFNITDCNLEAGLNILFRLPSDSLSVYPFRDYYNYGVYKAL